MNLSSHRWREKRRKHFFSATLQSMIIVIIISRRVWHCRGLDSVMNRRRASPSFARPSSLFVPLFFAAAADDRDLKS